MSRHLTYRFWAALAVGFGGLFGGLLLGQTAMFAFAIPALVMLVFSLVEGWWPWVGIRSVDPSSQRVIEGDVIHLDVLLSAPRRAPFVEIEVQLPASIEAAGPIRKILQINGERTVSFDLRLGHWGVVRPDWVTVVSRDRFGLSELVQHVIVNTPIRVHPPTERLTRLVPPGATRQATGDHRSSRRGSGSELAEIRPFRPGDPLRAVHPRLSARRGVPMVAERHVEEASDLIVYVDSIQDIGEGDTSSLRWTVTACMALAHRHLRSTDRVGLIDRGANLRWLEAGLGRRALHQIVDALLATAVNPDHHGETVLDRLRLPDKATVVAVSPLLSRWIGEDLQALHRRGHQAIVIQPAELGSEEAGTPLARRVLRIENELRLQPLRDSGVLIVPWDATEPLEPVVRRLAATRGRYGSRSRSAGGPR